MRLNVQVIYRQISRLNIFRSIKEQLDRILVNLVRDFFFALWPDAAKHLEHLHYVRWLVSSFHHEVLVMFLFLHRCKRGPHVLVARMRRLDFTPRSIGLDQDSIQRQLGGHLKTLLGPQRAAIETDVVA